MGRNQTNPPEPARAATLEVPNVLNGWRLLTQARVVSLYWRLTLDLATIWC
jgi:hypothetical protein